MSSNPASTFDYLCEWTEAHEVPSAESLAPRLLTLLKGEAIGVHGVQDASLNWSWPAEAPPCPCHALRVNDLRATLAARLERDAAGAWLECFVCDPRHGTPLVAWLFHREPHTWDASVQRAWPLVAQTLVRSLAQRFPQAAATAQLRQDLERAAQLTSRLSHDFGNYLTGILGFTELSLNQAPPGGLLHRYLNEVLQSARQGAAWVRRLAWYCRRTNQAVWPSELSSVIQATRAAVQESGSWNIQVPADLPLVAIDAASLQTALEELARNSLAAGGRTLTIAGRSVNLTSNDCQALLGLARPGRFIEITVADEGPGFAAEARAKVFQEPFYSTNPRHRGLGLLMAYGIARCFAGGVRIAPAEEGPGARVQLYFPAVDVGTARRGDSPRVLLVHQDRTLTEGLRKLLEAIGCQVAVAPASMVALGMYQSPDQKFDLVLAEATLPQLSGFDLARRILDRDAKARFVFLHTSTSFHGTTEPELLKRFALLRWPITPAAFLEAIQAALEK